MVPDLSFRGASEYPRRFVNLGICGLNIAVELGSRL